MINIISQNPIVTFQPPTHKKVDVPTNRSP